ncbi:hypothetical protein CK203_084987 [Vitis vinifera]|uniref:Uncharacterized protein n=1 Tax=Vitis vinifera TaxID=29760 RepID=A0A438F0B1_VITVI|nr:hypothetical protein CK203_084987 [Vitis vinifera]
MDGVKRKRSGKSNRLRKIAIVDRKRVDRIRFRAVCKNWLLAPVHYIQPDKLPWIMNYWFSSDPTICSLSEPSRKLPYILKDERAWNLLSHAIVCASRFGKKSSSAHAPMGIQHGRLWERCHPSMLLPKTGGCRLNTTGGTAGNGPLLEGCLIGWMGLGKRWKAWKVEQYFLASFRLECQQESKQRWLQIGSTISVRGHPYPGSSSMGQRKKRPADMGEKSESQDTINYAAPAGMGGSVRIWMEPPLLTPSGG